MYTILPTFETIIIIWPVWNFKDRQLMPLRPRSFIRGRELDLLWPPITPLLDVAILGLNARFRVSNLSTSQTRVKSVHFVHNACSKYKFMQNFEM